MKTLKVFGASDDLIEFSGIEGADEFYAKETREDLMGVWWVSTGKDVVEIRAYYLGYWAFLVAPEFDCNDGERMPDWKITRTWGTDVAYSETVTIEVPDDAILTRVS